MEIRNRDEKRILFVKDKLELKHFEICPIATDASSRNYFRIFLPEGKTLVLLDDEGCKCRTKEFVELSRFLREKAVWVPEVFAQDLENGFLLIEDLGDNTLTKLLQTQDEEHLYELATTELAKVAAITERPLVCGDLTKERLINDICFFVDWYYPMAAGKPLKPEKRKEFVDMICPLVDMAYKVPSRILLWDYHVDNVMLPKDGQVAIIDFQDAMWGPLTYDIMSLVEDARRELRPSTIIKMKEQFFASLKDVRRDDFEDSFAFLSMFRHMRVLGRFTILMAMHNKDRYLQFVPHLWNMLNRTLEYPKLKVVKNWLDENFAPTLRTIPTRKPIRKAMLLAAGRGTRMQTLTDDLPKPLIMVGQKSLIDYNFAKLEDANIRDVVVNLCYKGDLIKEHIEELYAKDFNLDFSFEDTALETGGGVKKALPLLKDEAFFVMNSDVLSKEDGTKPVLWRMVDEWNADEYDILLLLHNTAKIIGDNGAGIGDYRQEMGGKWERNVERKAGFPYMFAGISIIKASLFEGVGEDKFSLLKLFDKAQASGKLGGVINEGLLFHVGTPQAFAEANALFSKKT